MLPNIELILLALLHGSLIACVLLVAIFIILVCLLAAFSFGLLLVLVLDLHDFSSVVSEYSEMVKDDVKVGIVLVFAYLMHQAVGFVLDSRPWLKSKAKEFKASRVSSERLSRGIDGDGKGLKIEAQLSLGAASLNPSASICILYITTLPVYMLLQ